MLSTRLLIYSSLYCKHLMRHRPLVRTGYINIIQYYTTVPDSSKLIDLVKKELKSDLEVETKQVHLLKSVLADETNINNEKLKLNGDEVYKLAVATFQVLQQTEQDIRPATSLFAYSHQLGNIDGSYTYGQLLRAGQGCTANPNEAASIFTELSMKGHPYAQVMLKSIPVNLTYIQLALGAMYFSGLGVDQSFSRAFTLYKVSAQNMVPQAFRALGDMYRKGQGIAEDKMEAFKCYKRAVELGDSVAHLALAQMYNSGDGVDQSFEKTFEHHMSAAEAGLVIGIYNTATHYFSGKGVEHSFEKAAEYFHRAANEGFTPAQVNLGNMYYNGLGVDKDIQKAKQFYKMAAIEDKNAQLLLEEIEMEEQKLNK